MIMHSVLLFCCGITLFIVVLCALMCMRHASSPDVIRHCRSQKNVCIIYDPAKCDPLFVTSYGAFLRRCGYKYLVVGADTLTSLDADIVVIWQWRSRSKSTDVDKIRAELLKLNSNVTVILLTDSTVYQSSKHDGMLIVNDIASLRTTLDGIVEVSCIG